MYHPQMPMLNHYLDYLETVERLPVFCLHHYCWTLAHYEISACSGCKRQQTALFSRDLAQSQNGLNIHKSVHKYKSRITSSK